MSTRATIAAIATPRGRGGVGIIRVSGPQALKLARKLTGKHLPAPRRAVYTSFLGANGDVLDRGLLLIFPAPASYTGEPVVELQSHGNPVLLEALLTRLYALGAQPARPGEFTERAFLEGRLDLVQAEAVADLIEAGSAAAVRAAQRSLEGLFSQRVQHLQQALIDARLHVEAAIDFPDEEIDFLSDPLLAQRLAHLTHNHHELQLAAERGQRLRDGCVVAIVGRPNAGKSSLFNAIAGTDRAIVTEIAGTTRDTLREEIRLGDLGLTLVDTAGLRASTDPVEIEGIRRARMEAQRADHILLIVDSAEPDVEQGLDRLRAECPEQVPRTVLWNKIDLSGQAPDRTSAPRDTAGTSSAETWIHLSLHTGAGLAELMLHLQALAASASHHEGEFSARSRHVEALRRTGIHLAAAEQRLHRERAGELVAEELRLAQQTLSELTGAYCPDDLLGAIFGSFCIGK